MAENNLNRRLIFLIKLKTKIMQIQIKNKDLFFICHHVWQYIDYKFKYQVNQKVTANPDENHIQTIDVDTDTFMSCYNAISLSGYGYTCNLADKLIENIRQQVLDNIEDEEWLLLASKMEEKKQQDEKACENIIKAGRETVLT